MLAYNHVIPFTTDLVTQFRHFLLDIDNKCKAIRTALDQRLIGGNVKCFLLHHQIDVDAAPLDNSIKMV